MFISKLGHIVDLGDKLAGKLIELSEMNLIDEILEGLAVDNPEISSTLSNTVSKKDLAEISLFLKKLAGEIQPNEALRAYFGPISGIPANGLDWGWKANKKKNLPARGDLTLYLKGSASASAKILPGPTYAFTGDLGISGALKAPFNYFSISASASTTGGAKLEGVFKHHENIRVIEAIAVDLPILASLNRPEQLISNSFRSAELGLNGEVRLGMKLTAGKSFLTEIKANQVSVGMELDLGLEYSIDWSMSGNYQVFITLEDGRLTVKLNERDISSSSRALSIGANLKITGLKEAVAPAMKRLTGKANELNTLLATYSEPSALLKEKLIEQFNDASDDIKALAETLAGDKDAKSLVDGLIEKVINKVNQKTQHWTDLFDKKVDGIISEAVAELPIPAENKEELKTLVNDKLTGATDDMLEDLTSELKESLGSGGANIIKSLEVFGAARDEALGDLDKAAARLLQPVKKMLKKYREIEKKVIDAIELTEKHKLAIQYSRSVVNTADRSSLLTVDLNPQTESGQKVYQDMLKGDFRSALLLGLTDNAEDVQVKDGLFKDVFSRKVTSGFTINLFDINLTSIRTLDTNLTAESTATGSINIFKADGNLSKEVAGFGEGQSMCVGSILNFLAKGEEDSFTVQLTYEDKNVSRSELNDYLSSMEDANLITQEAVLSTMEAYKNLGDTSNDGRNLRVDTIIAFDQTQMNKLAGISALEHAEEELQNEEIYRVAINELVRSHRRISWADDALDILEATQDKTAEACLYDWRDLSTNKVRQKLKSTIWNRSNFKKTKKVVYDIRNRAESLVEFLDNWEDLASLELPRIGSDKRVSDTDLKAIRDQHQEMIKDLSEWVDARGFFVGLAREDLSRFASALLSCLRLLAEQDEAVVPVISWKEKDEVKRVVVV